MLGNVELSGEKIEIDIHDLSLDEEVGGRIIHYAQLLLNTWFTWKREEVSINYFAKSGERVCCVSVEGEICKEILEGKKELIKQVVELKIVSEHMWYLKGEIV